MKVNCRRFQKSKIAWLPIKLVVEGKAILERMMSEMLDRSHSVLPYSR